MATLWSVRIKRAQNRGQFTNKDRNDAGEWYSCAVGERSGGSDDEPRARVLWLAGVKFSDAVWGGDFKGAERQRRIILKEMKAS